KVEAAIATQVETQANPVAGTALQRTGLGEIIARGMVVGPDVRIVNSSRCLLTTKQTIRSQEPVAVLRPRGRRKENQESQASQGQDRRHASHRNHHEPPTPVRSPIVAFPSTEPFGPCARGLLD